jgi:hypothetical protein
MRSFILILLALINFSDVYSQIDSVNTVVNYKLPRRSVMLTEAARFDLKFNWSKSSMIANTAVGQVFRRDSSLVFLNASEETVKKEHLEEQQKGMKEFISMASKPIFYTSKIIKKNNYRALILNYQLPGQDIVTYWMFAQGNNNKMLLGIIEYKPGNAKSAHNTLNKFLNGMTFK